MNAHTRTRLVSVFINAALNRERQYQQAAVAVSMKCEEHKK